MMGNSAQTIRVYGIQSSLEDFLMSFSDTNVGISY